MSLSCCGDYSHFSGAAAVDAADTAVNFILTATIPFFCFVLFIFIPPVLLLHFHIQCIYISVSVFYFPSGVCVCVCLAVWSLALIECIARTQTHSHTYTSSVNKVNSTVIFAITFSTFSRWMLAE